MPLPLALICTDFLPFFLAGSSLLFFFFLLFEHFKWTNANMLALMAGVFECDDCGKIARVWGWVFDGCIVGRCWMLGCGFELIEGFVLGWE